MIPNNYGAYKSASEWLSFLINDETWQNPLKKLKAAQPDELKPLYDDAIRRLGSGETYEFWDIYNHDVKRVVKELWEEQKLSLSSLKLQTIGMLSLEWLEKNAPQSETTPNELDTEKAHDLLKLLVKAKMLDEKWQPLNLSSSEKALVAKEVCQRLNINNMWQVFGQQWNIKPSTLRSYYNKALDLRKTLDFIEKIRIVLR